MNKNKKDLTNALKKLEEFPSVDTLRAVMINPEYDNSEDAQKMVYQKLPLINNLPVNQTTIHPTSTQKFLEQTKDTPIKIDVSSIEPVLDKAMTKLGAILGPTKGQRDKSLASEGKEWPSDDLSDIMTTIKQSLQNTDASGKKKTWDDIVGQKQGISNLYLSYAVPVLQKRVNPPKLSSDQSVEPIDGRILLYGPPGTGKTSLIQTLVAELEKITTPNQDYNILYYEVSPSVIMKPYLGESEASIRSLFKATMYYNSQSFKTKNTGVKKRSDKGKGKDEWNEKIKTLKEFKYEKGMQKMGMSILFLDEIDVIVPENTGGGEDSQNVRSRVGELLIQTNHLMSATDSPNDVILCAATNYPWKISSAMVRRLQNRMYIPLPDVVDRITLFEKLRDTLPNTDALRKIRNHLDKSDTAETFAKLTPFYSASDIQTIFDRLKNWEIVRLSRNDWTDERGELKIAEEGKGQPIWNFTEQLKKGLPKDETEFNGDTLKKIIDEIPPTVPINDILQHEYYYKTGTTIIIDRDPTPDMLLQVQILYTDKNQRLKAERLLIDKFRNGDTEEALLVGGDKDEGYY